MSEDWMLAIQDIAFELKKLNENIIKFLAFVEAKQPHLEYENVIHEDAKTKTTQVVEKKGKYTWYPLRDGGKVRKCNNEPCPYFLKYNDNKKSYEHGKYDPSTESWSYVQDICDFYGGK